MDAPKAPQHVGHLAGRLVTTGLLPLSSLARLIREGGEEPGCLVDGRLALPMLAEVLTAVREVKGEEEGGRVVEGAEIKVEEFIPERERGVKEKVEAAAKLLGLHKVDPVSG